MATPVAIVENPAFPPTHWRIVRPFTRMRQNGIPAAWFWQDQAQIPVNPDDTVLVVQQQTGPSPAVAKKWLDERRPSVKAIVYETDDDVFTDAQIDHLRAADWLQGKTERELILDQEVARYFVDLCDAVTVSTDVLADVVRSFTTTPVYVVPNALDIRWFRAHMVYSRPWKGVVTVGWSGGRRSDLDLIPMAQAWGRVAKRFSTVQFVVGSPVAMAPIYRYVPEGRIVQLPWLGLEDWPIAMQVDIGCCPLRNTSFNRCRSPIKAMEYAIGGAAVVASPTVYNGLVQDTRNGFLAETADEWEAAIVDLIEKPDLRGMLQSQLECDVVVGHNLDRRLVSWTAAYDAIALASGS